MKLLLKILFTVLVIFQINICEAKGIVCEDVFLEVMFPNTFNVENSTFELHNDLSNTCKIERDLVCYRNSESSVKANAAKGVTNVIPKGKLANHLFKGAGKLADNPANRSLISKNIKWETSCS